MKNITTFILEAKMFNTFEDWIKSLKLDYTKEDRTGDPNPISGDEDEPWEEYILNDFDAMTSFAYFPSSNKFILVIDSLFCDMKAQRVDENPNGICKFPSDIKLFTKAKINKFVEKYENGDFY